MNRRRFIIGLISGSVAVGPILGSGAFSSVETDRSLTVEVVHDNDAYLSLRQLGSGKRSIEDGSPEQVEFRFPGFQEALDDPDLGLGKNSVYEFVFDAEEDDTRGLLRIKNLGTNTVELYSEEKTKSELGIQLFDVTDPNRTALRNDPVEISVGEYVDVGFRIETLNAQVGTHHKTLTIVTEITES